MLILRPFPSRSHLHSFSPAGPAPIYLGSKVELKECIPGPATVSILNVFFALQDGISDSFVRREEQRNGLLTRGHYSYTDGFRKQTGA